MLFTPNWMTSTFPSFSVALLLSVKRGRLTVAVYFFGLRVNVLGVFGGAFG